MKASSRVVLVTGASSGFGKSVAIALIERGYIVYAAARRVEQMEDIRALGGHPLLLDVSDEASCRGCVETILEQQGRIDVLFNNAGFGSYGTIEDTPMEQIAYQMEVNVMGAIRMMKLVLPAMRQQLSGRIINTSSLVGEISMAGLGYYAATKHALEAISSALRQEVKGLGIYVSMIKPGPVRTGFEGVALTHLDHTPMHEVYQPLIRGFKRLNQALYKAAPGPEGTLKAVIDAIESTHPSHRYRTTWDARFLPRLIRIMGSRLSDRVTLYIMARLG